MPDETTPVPKKAKAEADAQNVFVALFAKNPLAAILATLLLGGGSFGGVSLKQNTAEMEAMRRSVEDIKSEFREFRKETAAELRDLRKDLYRSGITSMAPPSGLGTGNGRFFAAPPVDLTMKPAEGKEGFPTP